MNQSNGKKHLMLRKVSLAFTVLFSLLIGVFFELELSMLQDLNYALYWQVGSAFYLLMLVFVLGVYGHSFLHIEKEYKMETTIMQVKRVLHYALHYFVLPTFLYFSLLTVLFFTSSVALQHTLVWLSAFGFFSILICVLKVVRCAPQGYALPDTKKMLYYYICRVKFCFFYKLYVAFLMLTALYVLSVEHFLPVIFLPFAIGISVYILLTHNMLFTVNWSWNVQRRALMIAISLAALSMLIRVGKVHFLIAGVVLLTFYHIFEGFFFHKMVTLKKEILQKYMLMGVLALLVVVGSFDLDIGGMVELPDENFARVHVTESGMPGQIGETFTLVASVVTLVFFLVYFVLFKRSSKKPSNTKVSGV